MSASGFLQIGIYFLLIFIITKPVGLYLTAVLEGEKIFLHKIFRPLEAWIYRVSGIDEKEDMHWIHYTKSMLLFSVVGCVLSYMLLRMQGLLPLNPQNFGKKEMEIYILFCHHTSNNDPIQVYSNIFSTINHRESQIFSWAVM